MQSSAEEDLLKVWWIYGCISEEEAHVWDVHYRICSPILFLICPFKRASAECERVNNSSWAFRFRLFDFGLTFDLCE